MRNLLPGEGPEARHEYSCWEVNSAWGRHCVQAIRNEDWEIKHFVESNRIWFELCNLRTDIWGFNNLASHHPEMVVR